VRGHSGPHARFLLGRAVVLVAVTGLVAVLVAAVTSGRAGVLGALLGTVLVLGYLLVGQSPISAAARGGQGAGTALLILLYTLRLMVLIILFRAFSVSDAVDGTALGLTMIACGLVWTAGVVWSAMRWRPMVV